MFRKKESQLQNEFEEAQAIYCKLVSMNLDEFRKWDIRHQIRQIVQTTYSVYDHE